ncbi:MAG TPA: PAS domain S-box protein [Bacteroidia bacterium]|jgi:PAS domain S-box-containing protein
MKLSLEKKVLFGFIGNLILVLIFAWVSHVQLRNLKSLDLLESDHHQKIYASEKISSIINSIDNVSKSYVITGDSTYLTTFNKNLYSIERQLEQLSVLLENEPEQKNRLVNLENILTEKTVNISRFVELRRYRDFETARDLVKNAENIQTSDRLNKSIAEIQAEENKLYLKRKNERLLVDNRYSVIFTSLLICLLCLLVVVYYIIRMQLKAKKRAEMLLQANNQLVRSIIDNTSNPIFIKQINGVYLLVNKEFERLFGYSNEELRGKSDQDIFPGEIADVLRASDLDVIKAGKEIKVEEVFPQPGGLHNYIVVKFPLWDIFGKIYAIGAIATDITERSKLGTLLKESEEELRVGLDAAPDAVIVVNEEGVINRWNRKAEELFGWAAHEVIGKKIDETIMPQRYKEKYQEKLKQFLSDKDIDIFNKMVELSALTKKQVELDIELSIAPVIIKDKYIFIGFIRDITKRKLFEKEIQESKQFLNSIVENIPSMVFVKDVKELRFISFNKAGEKLLGYSASEIMGKNDYDLFPKEQADFFTSKDRDVLNKGVLVDIPEEPIDTKKGKKWLHTQKIPIRDLNGKPLYLMGISEDITEKKKLERERAKAELQLKENQERMRLILENIGEGVIVVDQNEKIILFNRMAEEIIGVKEDHTIFTPADWSDEFDLYYADGKTVFPAQKLPLERALKGESTDDVEIVMVDPETKKKKIIKVNGRPVWDKDDYIIAAVATIRDVTEYKKLQEELKKSRNMIGFKRDDDKSPE